MGRRVVEQADGSATPARTRPRRAVAMVGAVSWLVFGLAWWRVGAMHAQVGNDVLLAVLVCALLVLGVDVWWVRHNRRIYVRKGPRRGLPAPHLDGSRDALGRPVEWAVGASDAQVVVLDLEADSSKTFRPGTV
jgi:hypothetical protein